jgi:hypothetical protein
MPGFDPTPRFVPWRFRLRPSTLPKSFEEKPAYGWLTVHLVRTPRQTLLLSRSKLRPPILFASAPQGAVLPPRVYLQAVNRSSTF